MRRLMKSYANLPVVAMMASVDAVFARVCEITCNLVFGNDIFTHTAPRRIAHHNVMFSM